MEVYDGKLYVGTHDASSLLECFGQFVNGNPAEAEPPPSGRTSGTT